MPLLPAQASHLSLEIRQARFGLDPTGVFPLRQCLSLQPVGTLLVMAQKPAFRNRVPEAKLTV